ncbi:MAG: outer membrane protein assembly factor BamE [Gammaproteobacteria bacterium]|nr:outer membrane protein assembly factor BamE [Gammaproteobacteria bacterium]
MKTIYPILFLLAFFTSGCVYKMDIEQGNAIDSEKLELLKLGMSKKQVSFLLGKPSINDHYHENMWHYIRYLEQDSGKKTAQSSMTLQFKNDKLIDIKGKL